MNETQSELLDLIRSRMVEGADGAPVDGDTIWPSEILAILGSQAEAPALDWRGMFVRYIEAVLYSESYDLLDGVEWTPEELAAVKQAAEEARAR